MKLGPGPAAALLLAAAATALLADRLAVIAAVAAVLLAVCLRAPARRLRPYLFFGLVASLGVMLFSPLLALEGGDVLWSGPVVPVLGPLDVTVEELVIAAENALRLAGVTLAFTAYALLLDHDQLVSSASFARRSSLAVALATRLVPTLERDATGLVEAVRGRGLEVNGARGHARMLFPLVAGSLERAFNLAEAMEARGFGRPGRTRVPGPPWSRLDRAALVVAPVLVLGGILWF